MDPASLVGIILALLCLGIGVILEGGNLASYAIPSAFIIVVPSTIGASLAGGYLSDFPIIFAWVKKAFLTPKTDPTDNIETMVKFAERARREGLLALEEAIKEVKDEFLKKGIEMAVDGTDPEQLREILEAEILAKRKRDKIPAKFFGDMGGFSPTLGIIGTVLGLVVVLQNLSDPGSLGPHIAVAFIATLYGVSFANLIWLPLSKKIARVSDVECDRMELIVEGVLSIQAGANPRIIQQKLSAFIGEQKASSGKKAA